MIRNGIILIFILNFSFNALSQNSRLTLNIFKAKSFYNAVKSSLVIVPLTQKSETEKKALKEAFRKYWKICPYKFITKDEFEKSRGAEKKGAHTIYLVKETYERLKYSRKDWAYVKYYLTPEPEGVEILDAPYIEFKLPVTTEQREVKEVDYSFIYGLMIKQMNHDLMLIGKQNEYNKIKRKSLIKASFDKGLSSYASKELLVSKVELENYIMNLDDDQKQHYKQSKFLKYLSKKTKLDINLIKMVSDEEIKKAVQVGDANKLIYTGFTIYNAADGKMLRRIDPNRSRRKVKGFFTVVISAAIVGVGLYYFQP